MTYIMSFKVSLLTANSEPIPQEGLVENTISNNLLPPLEKTLKKLLQQHGLKVEIKSKMYWEEGVVEGVLLG